MFNTRCCKGAGAPLACFHVIDFKGFFKRCCKGANEILQHLEKNVIKSMCCKCCKCAPPKGGKRALHLLPFPPFGARQFFTKKEQAA